MEKSSFFNSVNGDRKYKASDFAEFFNSLITNGVFPNPSSNLQVIANNNMTVTIKVGKAWINGYIYINDSDLVLPIDVADGVLKRIDRVVIQYSTANREIKAKIKKGTFASTPVAPGLQRDADIYELGIADISITNGAVSVVQANITDLRLNNSYCGIVNSLIQADTTTLLNQYTDGFNTWFNSIKNTLGSDIAGNLLNQIGTLGNLTTTAKDSLVSAINELKSTFTSHQADDMKHIDYAVASGTNTYTATIANITALTEGISVKVKFTNANTGASTLNISGLGAKSILKGNGSALASGNIKAGQICHLVYTGTVFQLLGEGGEYGTATADKVLTGYSIGTDTGLVNGTMPNRGAFNLALGASVPYGYYSGGTVPSGKRWATGTVGVSGSTASFTYASDAISSSYYVEVSGLSFKPSVIILKWFNGGDYVTMYDEMSPSAYPKSVKVAYFNPSTTDYATTRYYKGDVSSASVVSGYFKLPVCSSGGTFSWLAIE